VTYENAQARERTQCCGYGQPHGRAGGRHSDLSELALGWATTTAIICPCTGECLHPKTLVRHLVAYEAERAGTGVCGVLLDILDTPVSPELLPPSEGEIQQKTEDLVGPYELHDFFLY
jgi:NAD+ synthase (glutamine-hydrolysing)